MSQPDDGGPAFPAQASLEHFSSPRTRHEPGMSLRAYIAVHRPASEDMSLETGRILVGSPIPGREEFSGDAEGADAYLLACRKWWAFASAAYSVMQADALLAVLKGRADG